MYAEQFKWKLLCSICMVMEHKGSKNFKRKICCHIMDLLFFSRGVQKYNLLVFVVVLTKLSIFYGYSLYYNNFIIYHDLKTNCAEGYKSLYASFLFLKYSMLLNAMCNYKLKFSACFKERIYMIAVLLWE